MIVYFDTETHLIEFSECSNHIVPAAWGEVARR